MAVICLQFWDLVCAQYIDDVGMWRHDRVLSVQSDRKQGPGGWPECFDQHHGGWMYVQVSRAILVRMYMCMCV